MQSPYSAFDHRCMARAIQLAEATVPFSQPNPAVGCVIALDGRVVGEGNTQPAGQAHAEVMALQAAGHHAQGATAYVSLEPCCTQGRTGPCTDALAAAGIARVVYAIDDPNPAVDGAGANALRAAGIQVQSGLMAAAAKAPVRGFHSRFTRGRPWLTLKMASSLDGAIAMRSGESQWITSPEARADVQHFRARHAAILTGIGTVLADDPALTVRDPRYAGLSRQPLRVIADGRARTPSDAQVLTQDEQVLVVAAQETPAPVHLASVFATVPANDDGLLDLAALLNLLAARDINSVWAECGPALAGALLATGLVDTLICYLAPRALGSDSQSMFTTPGWQRLADGVAFAFDDVRHVGPDLRLTLSPRYP
ncbi:MAG: bifunctional diaminohydroxyphosphoribosylaminopyrimidine deaminase/5-amino-6-(5-phosphoribosylamino)uracil reductase RibD [Pseudomonadota bacterium]